MHGPTHDVGGLLDPKDAFKSLLLRGKVPMRGSSGVSVEEGLVRSIAADAAGDENDALNDKTLSRSSGRMLSCGAPLTLLSLSFVACSPPLFFLPALTRSARPPH